MVFNSNYVTSVGKRALVAIGFAVALMGVTDSARASIIAWDGFDYPLGEINGQNGGLGWGGTWAGVQSLTEVVDPGTPLSYPVPGGENLTGGDRALQVTGNNDNAVWRALSSAQSGDTVFISFLVRTAGSFTVNDFASFWFDNAATGTHTTRPNLGIKADGAPGGLDFVSRLVIGSEGYSTAAVSDTTYLVVGRLSKSISGAGNNYDRFALWVNPTATEANSPDVTVSVGGNISSFTTVGLRTANLDPGDSALFDNLQLATTFEEAVSAIPEPGSMMLLSFGGALLILFGRRRAVRG